MRQFPKSMRVGKKRYTVERWMELPRNRRGYVLYLQGLIKLAVHSRLRGRDFTYEEQHETFWHETTHAILHEMGSPLCSDEKFVDKFAKHLSTAILTARFE